MRSESVVEAAQGGGGEVEEWVVGVRMELGPYRSFYTELVMAFTELRSG